MQNRTRYEKATPRQVFGLLLVVGGLVFGGLTADAQYSWSIGIDAGAPTPFETYRDIYLECFAEHDGKLFVAGWEGRTCYVYDGVTVTENAQDGNELNLGINPHYYSFVRWDAGDGTGERTYLVGMSSAYGGRSGWFRFNDASDDWEKAMPIPPLAGSVASLTNQSAQFYAGGIVFQGDMYIAGNEDPTGADNSTLYRLRYGASAWEVAWSSGSTDNFSPSDLLVYDDGGGEKLYIMDVVGKIYAYDGVNPATVVADFGVGGGFYSYYVQDMTVHNDLIYITHSRTVYTFDGTTLSLAYDFDASTALTFPIAWVLHSWRGKLFVSVSGSGLMRIFEHTGTDPTANWTEILDSASWPTQPVGSHRMFDYNDKLYVTVNFKSFSSHIGSNPLFHPKVYEITGPPWDKNASGLCVICP